MPLWRRRRRPPESFLFPPNVLEDWIDRGYWQVWPPPRNLIAGESNYRAAFVGLCAEVRDDGWCRLVQVLLVREPDNQYDSNAIRAEVAGARVGYLRAAAAAQISPHLDSIGCAGFAVPGVIRGGWPDARDFGVHIWLEKRLSMGPEIELGDGEYAAGWPPRPEEFA